MQLDERESNMRRIRTLVAVCGCVILTTMLASCSNRPTLHHVAGKVVYKGRSLEGAVVMFHPEDAALQKQPFPQGVVGNDGSFQLSTYSLNDGAPAGRYKVTVTLEIVPEGGERDDSYIASPQRYTDPDTSGLTADVPSGGGELPPFTLVKD
jgi:hypothetical protein